MQFGHIKRLLKAVLPADGSAAPVALVTAPFGPLSGPSIQLGLLKAILARHGFPATVYYLNLPFARLIAFPRYAIMARRSIIEEWIFSEAAFGPRDDDMHYFREIPQVDKHLRDLGWTRKNLLELKRKVVPQYVRACIEAIPWHRHSIVGFSSVFQQNAASLAISRAIKERFPEIKVVMGGANYDGEMGVEYTRAFPWIDYAVIGEGDEIFPKLAGALLAGEQVPLRPGVAIRSRNGTQGAAEPKTTIPIVSNPLGEFKAKGNGNGDVAFLGPAPMVMDLTSSPPPDYDEYFETGKRLNLFGKWGGGDNIFLLFESS